MELVALGFFLFLLLFIGIRILDYSRTYKNTPTLQIFWNFPEYFIRVFFRHDLSFSSKLKNEIGDHSIIHQSLMDAQGKLIISFMIILCQSGIFLVAPNQKNTFALLKQHRKRLNDQHIEIQEILIFHSDFKIDLTKKIQMFPLRYTESEIKLMASKIKK